MERLVLSWPDVYDRLLKLPIAPGQSVWGVPRGGAVVAGLLVAFRNRWGMAVSAAEADVIIDDIRDSGATVERFGRLLQKPVVVLVDKPKEGLNGTWVQFPWEAEPERDIEDHIRRIIEYIGDDPGREDLKETPARIVKAWKEIFGGYADPEPRLKWFTNNADEMVIIRDIDFFSMCEHHMLPFWGKADVAYIPNGKVVGISKIPRLVDHMARRLIIQERLAQWIGDAFDQEGVKGVAVSLRAYHMCMRMRGVKQANATLTTNHLTGLFRSDPAARAEFMQGVKP